MGLENYQKCRICNHIFMYSGYGPRICPVCRQKDEEDFRRVKEYLRDNPGRTMTQTAEDCEIEIERIREWLRDERLEYTDAKDSGLTCERCGKLITSGKLCEACRQENSRLVGEMMRSMEAPAPEARPTSRSDKDKMRFLVSCKSKFHFVRVNSIL